MVLKEITYSIGKKRYIIKAKVCNSFLDKVSGLMFRKQSHPLLFVFNNPEQVSIHSFFCRPFKAIWLDDKMKATKIVDVKVWETNISGRGKYLLEIPINQKI